MGEEVATGHAGTYTWQGHSRVSETKGIYVGKAEVTRRSHPEAQVTKVHR